MCSVIDFSLKAEIENMKMHSNKYSKILYHFLLGIISVVVTTLPCAASIPTTLSPITASVNKTPILHFNTVENTGMDRV